MICVPQHTVMKHVPQHKVMIRVPQHKVMIHVPQHKVMIHVPQNKVMICVHVPQHTVIICVPQNKVMIHVPQHKVIIKYIVSKVSWHVAELPIIKLLSLFKYLHVILYLSRHQEHFCFLLCSLSSFFFFILIPVFSLDYCPCHFCLRRGLK